MGGMTDAQTPTVPTPEQDRERLKQLIQELAVVHGRVTLSSGKEADYYVDLRRVTLHHEAAPLIGRVMLRLLADNGVDFETMGGLTMGADPVATAMMHQAGTVGRALDAFVVRKAQKSYGMGRQVEGPGVDRYLSPEIEETVRLVKEGALIDAVEDATGKLRG